MQDFIAEIYEYAKLTSEIRECIKLSRAGIELEVKEKWLKIQPVLMDFCIKVTYEDKEAGKNLFEELSAACAYVNGEIGDYTAFADSMESIIPSIYAAMDIFGSIDTTEGKYHLYSSTSGLLTLENVELKQRYHSELDPLWEAYERAQAEYETDCTCYHILGCGLGYLPYQIFCASNKSVDIVIYHSDPAIVEYALEFGVLSWIPEHKLKIVIDENIDNLTRKYLEFSKDEGKTGFVFIKDALSLFSEEQANRIFELDTLNRTRIRLTDLVRINLTRNVFNVHKTAHIFKPKTKSDEWIIVAGGPSVDAHMDFIRENMGKKVIICASTIYRRLIEAGIIPDAVAVLDSHSRTFGHFKDITNEEVPLIMAATANWQFSEYYGGDKYLIAGMGNAAAIELFKKQGLEPWFLGTTVSTMLLEIAIHLDAKRIHFIGIDLSYPNGKSHAANTMDAKKVDTTNMLDVMAVNGETVKTSKQFMIYFREIQKIILENQNIDFINYSIDGIKFEGTKWYKDI